MSRRFLPALLAAAAIAPAAHAQFTLFAVDAAGGEHVAGAVYSLGTVYPGEPVSARFRVRNTSAAKATLSLFTVSGTGFTLASGPMLPMSLDPQAYAEFTVGFRAADSGTYSAALQSDGISAFLTASVPSRLTYQVESGGALVPLSSAPLDFGTVEVGSAAVRHFVMLNQQSGPLSAPGIAVQGTDFAPAGALPSGVVLQPGQSAAFDVRFTPSATGPRAGSLALGERAYAITGTGAPPALPKPTLSIALPQVRSAQQGTVTVDFDAPAKTAGSGTLTLDFRPTGNATDPTIAFASGGRTAAFTLAAGDTQARFAAQSSLAFQTGTTAGTLVFTATLGSATDQQTISIAPGAVGVTGVSGTRSGSGVEIDVTAFDNTRTAGPVTFTFFDTAGNAIAPGAVRADATAAFAGYFPNSGLGGAFLLKAVFPVTGDASRIASVEVQLANSAGTTITPRSAF
jgi:hypothetical protein